MLALLTHAGVLALSTALGVWHTWPLALTLRGGWIAGHLDDPWMNAWHLWWMRRALWSTPHNPFETPLLHWPLGAQMYWHTLAPAKTAWGVLLLPWLPPEGAHNVVILGTFTLTGYTAWLLMRSVLARAGTSGALGAVAAFAGACVFNLSRYHLTHAVAHVNLASLEGLPLSLFFFLRWLDGGRRRDLAGLGLSALYLALCDYYYLVYVALFCAAWLVAQRWREGGLLARGAWRSPTLRRGAAAAVVAGLCTAPIVLALLAHAFPPPTSPHHGDSDYYADLLGFVLPDRASALFATLSSELQQQVLRLPGNMEENGYFFGWVTLAIAVLALRRRAPDAARWAGIGGGFVLLSLGTCLSVGGETRLPVAPLLVAAMLVVTLLRPWRAGGPARDLYVLGLLVAAACLLSPPTAFGRAWSVELPLPYPLFKQVVPFFSRGGMPVRLALMGTLSLGVLVAFAAAQLGAWAAREGRSAPLGLACAGAVALVPTLEYRSAPFPLTQLPPRSAIFDRIRAEPPDVAVFVDGHPISQFEQVWHEHPISAARLSRVPVPEAELVQSRLYRALQDLRELDGPVSPEEQARMRGFLREHHFRYYVTHYGDPRLQRFVTEVLGGTQVYRDAYVLAYTFD
ncbi:hypothetical protein FGE12_09925 [Aggregicoccus sp. 17bor-14]|nr:hypothetical protein [Simulacricoccus sp. 17bor-14]MRI88485.1 hypothetical protein [Aggregicoccus sp. 17bor-14]